MSDREDGFWLTWMRAEMEWRHAAAAAAETAAACSPCTQTVNNWKQAQASGSRLHVSLLT